MREHSPGSGVMHSMVQIYFSNQKLSYNHDNTPCYVESSCEPSLQHSFCNKCWRKIHDKPYKSKCCDAKTSFCDRCVSLGFWSYFIHFMKRYILLICYLLDTEKRTDFGAWLCQNYRLDMNTKLAESNLSTSNCNLSCLRADRLTSKISPILFEKTIARLF